MSISKDFRLLLYSLNVIGEPCLESYGFSSAAHPAHDDSVGAKFSR